MFHSISKPHPNFQVHQLCAAGTTGGGLSSQGAQSLVHGHSSTAKKGQFYHVIFWAARAQITGASTWHCQSYLDHQSAKMLLIHVSLFVNTTRSGCARQKEASSRQTKPVVHPGQSFRCKTHSQDPRREVSLPLLLLVSRAVEIGKGRRIQPSGRDGEPMEGCNRVFSMRWLAAADWGLRSRRRLSR